MLWLPKVHPVYSPEEYLTLEETAEYRSEYQDGEIVPMAGGSINHNRIIRNISRLTEIALQGQPYEVFTSDLRVGIPQYRQLECERKPPATLPCQYTYPDVLIIQGEPIFEVGRTDTILNPAIIFEGLSQSTSSRDRGDKFTYYRSIPQLRIYYS